MINNKGIWKRLPFARPLSCSLLGILLNEYLKLNTGSLLLISCPALVMVCLDRFLPLWLRWKILPFKGIALMVLLVAAGALHHSLRTINAPIILETSKDFLLKIEDQKETGERIRFTAAVYVVEKNKAIKKGACYVYTNKDAAVNVEKGDLIFTQKRPRSITNNTNPGSFDFAGFASRKGIYFTLFLETGTWVRLNRTPIQPPLLDKLRKKLLSILGAYFSKKEHRGLAEAMLIGYRNDLDSSILGAYIDTGVVHIIAISGMHLGLIFLLLDKMIVLLLGKNRSSTAALFISMPLLWGFTLLTGASASVLRSALMFSMMIIGRAIERGNISLNALLGSAFILLLYDPMLVQDLGFQLSFAAVGSILLFDKIINKMLFLQNRLASHAWSMISLTLSAQVLTTPLVILHFHRFPLLFLFANLVAVPLSSIILVSEIALVVVHQATPLASWLANMITVLMDWMNGYVFMISTVPHAVLEGLYFSKPMIMLSTLLLMLLAACIRSPSKQQWRWLLVLLMLTATLRLVESWHVYSKKNLVVFHLYKHTCVLVQYGHQGTFFVSASLLQHQDQLRSTTTESSKALGISKWKIRVIPATPMLITLNQAVASPTLGNRQFTLVTGNARIQLSALHPAWTKGKTIVVDGANKLWKIREWEKEAHALHLRLHPTPEKGAFILP